MTMPDDILQHNRELIEKFREDGGASMGDRPLLLLTTLGAHSGEERTSPMMFVRDGGRLLVIASNMGSAKHPAWFHNLVAHPQVTVEVPGDTFSAAAAPLEGDEHDRAWAQIVADHPFFADHQKQTDRTIPIVALERVG